MKHLRPGTKVVITNSDDQFSGSIGTLTGHYFDSTVWPTELYEIKIGDFIFGFDCNEFEIAP